MGTGRRWSETEWRDGEWVGGSGEEVIQLCVEVVLKLRLSREVVRGECGLRRWSGGVYETGRRFSKRVRIGIGPQRRLSIFRVSSSGPIETR